MATSFKITLDNQEALQESGFKRSSRWSPTSSLLRAGLLLLIITGITLAHQPLRLCLRQLSHHCYRERSVEERAREILATTPLIDGHIDLALLIRAKDGGKIDNDLWRDSFKTGPFPGDLDIARLRAGQSGGAFWSVWAPCPENGTDFSHDNLRDQVQFTYDQIDLMTRIHALFPDDFSHSQGLNVEDAKRAFQKGKFISPMGIEGLHQIGNMASNLRRYHAMGVRYATLTHNCHNKYADAALQEYPLRKATPVSDGISDDGRKLINEMNRIGMIVDLSHVSAKTMEDILQGKSGWEGSKAPVMFSHSSAFAICPHPRNVPDHILELVKQRNSVVMVNVAGQFIACEDAGAGDGIPIPIPEDNTILQVAKHILYIGNLIGFDHVGIGSDFDGIPDQPAGFEDVTRYPDLVAELLRQGVSDEDVSKIVGKNILRVWEDVETVAARLQAEGQPALEDDLSYSGPY